MILAIETSSPKAGLALWDPENGKAIHEEKFSTDRAHNSVIFGYAKTMLEKCDRKLDRIAVGLGPGSYSGVRVGIALANGLGLAMVVPAVGVSSLLAYPSENSGLGNYVVVGDARRKTRFIALIRDGQLIAEPELIPENEFTERIDELIAQEGFDSVYTPDRKVADELSVAELAHPTALAIAKYCGNQREIDYSMKLEPHYLRAPYITKPKKR